MTHVYLAVTCHLHFWQNDWGLLHAIVVTRGWNRYRKSQHRKLPWRTKFSHRSCRESNSEPFDHESAALSFLTTELSPLPFLNAQELPNNQVSIACPVIVLDIFQTNVRFSWWQKWFTETGQVITVTSQTNVCLTTTTALIATTLLTSLSRTHTRDTHAHTHTHMHTHTHHTQT